MKQTVILVHGFNVWDGGTATVDTLIPSLRYKYNIQQFDYGWIGLLGVKLFGKKIARKLAKETPDGAIGIGHSNGCMELVRACEYGAQYEHLVFINPALDNDIVVPEHVKTITVFHNVDDTTVTLAKYYPFSYWGDMGRVGYQGNDERFTNIETKELLHVEGHSGVFTEPEWLSVVIVDCLEAYRGN